MKFEEVDDDTYARQAAKVFKDRYQVEDGVEDSNDDKQSIDFEDHMKFNTEVFR